MRGLQGTPLFEAVFPNGSERFFNGEPALCVVMPFGRAIAPQFPLLGRAMVGLFMRHVLAQKQRQVAIHSEEVRRMKEWGSVDDTWAVLTVKINQRLRSMQLGVIPAGNPKRRVQTRVKGVVDGQEIPNVIPGLRTKTIVVSDERGVGSQTQSMSESASELIWTQMI